MTSVCLESGKSIYCIRSVLSLQSLIYFFLVHTIFYVQKKIDVVKCTFFRVTRLNNSIFKTLQKHQKHGAFQLSVVVMTFVTSFSAVLGQILDFYPFCKALTFFAQHLPLSCRHPTICSWMKFLCEKTDWKNCNSWQLVYQTVQKKISQCTWMGWKRQYYNTSLAPAKV